VRCHTHTHRHQGESHGGRSKSFGRLQRCRLAHWHTRRMQQRQRSATKYGQRQKVATCRKLPRVPVVADWWRPFQFSRRRSADSERQKSTGQHQQPPQHLLPVENGCGWTKKKAQHPNLDSAFRAPEKDASHAAHAVGSVHSGGHVLTVHFEPINWLRVLCRDTNRWRWSEQRSGRCHQSRGRAPTDPQPSARCRLVRPRPTGSTRRRDVLSRRQTMQIIWLQKYIRSPSQCNRIGK
jgi:hypothetical protein